MSRKDDKTNFLEKIKNNLWTYDLNNYRNIMGDEIQSLTTIYSLKSFFEEKIKADEGKNNLRLARMYSYMALIHVRLSLYQEAKEYFIDELDLLYKDSKPVAILPLLKVVNHINLGNIYHYMNETKAALVCYKHSFELLEEVADSTGGAPSNIQLLTDSFFPLVCFNLGQLSEFYTQYENALSFYSLSQDWFECRLPKDVNMLAKIGLSVVRLFIKSKQYHRVSPYCTRIKKCLREKMYEKKLNYHLFNWDREEQTGDFSSESSSELESETDLASKKKHDQLQPFKKIANLLRFKNKIEKKNEKV